LCKSPVLGLACGLHLVHYQLTCLVGISMGPRSEAGIVEQRKHHPGGFNLARIWATDFMAAKEPLASGAN
jgi:hypothetical protein